MNSVTFASRIPHREQGRLRHISWLWPWIGLFATLGVAVPVLMPGQFISMDRQWLFVVALALLILAQIVYQRQTRHFLSHVAKQAHARQLTAIPQWPVLGLVLWTMASVGIAINRTAAWEAAGYLLLGLALYQSLPQLPWLQRRPGYLAWALCLFGMGVLALAPPLVEWKQEFRLFYVPIYEWFQSIALDIGETIHANILAGALVPLVTLCVALALPPIQHHIAQVEPDSLRLKYVRVKRRRADRVQQAVAGGLAFCLFTLLLLTQSRGAYIGILGALLFLSILRWRRLLWLLPLLLLGLGLLILNIGPGGFFELLGADNTFGGAEWRTAIWQIAFQAVHDFAYTGIGIGNFRTTLSTLYPHPALTAESANHAHNLWLQITLDLGLVGLFSYLFLLGTLLWRAIRFVQQRAISTTMIDGQSTADAHTASLTPAQSTLNSRQRHRRLVHQARLHNENWAITAGAVAALVGIQVHGILDAVTWGTKFAFLPWLLFALIWLTATPPPASHDLDAPDR